MDKALAIQKQVIEILGTDEVYLVGGSVRDIVLGNEPKDYDFCTPMLPDDIEKAVQDAGRHAYGIGKRFGTIGFKVKVPVKVINVITGEEEWQDEIHWGYEYVEVTTFRSEIYTSKSRKPEVQFVPSLDEDLARRDFTMNAMVLKVDGSIHDPYGGRIDILGRKLTTVGMPKDRIQEDPLRMLRAARFAARYNFTIDPNFIGKARQLWERIYDVSVERWVQELDKLLTSEHSHAGLQALEQMALLGAIIPELENNGDSEYPNFSTTVYDNADVAWKDLLSGRHVSKKLDKYVDEGICARLKFSNDRRDLILNKVKKA